MHTACCSAARQGKAHARRQLQQLHACTRLNCSLTVHQTECNMASGGPGPSHWSCNTSLPSLRIARPSPHARSGRTSRPQLPQPDQTGRRRRRWWARRCCVRQPRAPRRPCARGSAARQSAITGACAGGRRARRWRPCPTAHRRPATMACLQLLAAGAPAAQALQACRKVQH